MWEEKKSLKFPWRRRRSQGEGGGKKKQVGGRSTKKWGEGGWGTKKCLKASCRRCYNTHWSRDSVSTVCGIFFWVLLEMHSSKLKSKCLAPTFLPLAIDQTSCMFMFRFFFIAESLYLIQMVEGHPDNSNQTLNSTFRERAEQAVNSEKEAN